MNCGLPELNKENVMFVIDKHVNALEIMRDDFEEKVMKDVEGGYKSSWASNVCIIMCEKY